MLSYLPGGDSAQDAENERLNAK